MKNLLLIVPIAALVFAGCAPKEYQTADNVVSSAIYPIGIDLNTVEGNIWVYNSSDVNGKSYQVQIKSIQNGLANFQDPDNKEEYVGTHTFGHQQIGYNADGDLIGKTGNVQQVIIPNTDGNSNYNMTAGLFAGKAVSVSVDQGVHIVSIADLRIELQRGLGITRITSGVGVDQMTYDLESTIPDPPVHYGQ